MSEISDYNRHAYRAIRRRRDLKPNRSDGSRRSSMEIVNDAIDREMGSTGKRAFRILAALRFLYKVLKPSEVVLLIFSAAPLTAFDNNPHGRNAETIISEWNLTGQQAWIPGLLQSLFYLGFMPGAIIFGQLSDFYGRRNVSWKGYLLVLLIQVVTGFCQTWQQLAICRVVRGFFTGGLSVADNIMMQELSGSQLWVFNGVVLGSLTFTLNTFIYILFSYYFPSWRTLYFVTAIPGILGFFYYAWCPESPRWLVSHGKYNAAENALSYLCKCNGAKDNTTRYHLLQNGQESDEFGSSDRRIPEESSSKTYVKNEKGSIVDLVRDRVLRSRSFIMGLQWFTASLVYYCFTLGSSAFSSNFYLANAISSFSQLPSVPLTMFLMEKKWFGRKRTLSGFMWTSALATFVMYVIPFSEDQSNYKLCLLLVGKLGVSSAFDLIYIYTAEIYPTVVRNVGLGAMSTCARVGGIIAPYLANIMVFYDSQTPFLWYGICCVLCGVLALYLPETRAQKPPNTIEELYHQKKI